jgi:hypothetical protein
MTALDLLKVTNVSTSGRARANSILATATRITTLNRGLDHADDLVIALGDRLRGDALQLVSNSHHLSSGVLGTTLIQLEAERSVREHLRTNKGLGDGGVLLLQHKQ